MNTFFQNRSTSVAKSLLLVNLLLSFATFAASDWDVYPTPLDQLEKDGIPRTVSDIGAVFLNVRLDINLRVTAGQALAQLDDPEVIPFLVRGLRDNDENVRAAAAFALGFYDTERAQVLLAKVLDDDTSRVAKRTAINALARTESAHAVPTLVNFADRQDEDRDVRMAALFALDSLRIYVPSHDLIHFLDDPHPDIRGKASLILYKKGYENYVKNVVSIVVDKDTDYLIFTEALEAVEEISGKSFSSGQSFPTDTAFRHDIHHRVRDWWEDEKENWPE